MLMITVFFLYVSTLFDNRILLPFYVCVMLMIGTFCGRFISAGGLKRAGAVVFMLVFAALLFEDELDLIREYHRNGQGFAGAEWRESETRLAALDLPKEKLLWSNRQTALYLLNDQPAYVLPAMFDAASFTEKESFEKEQEWMAGEVLSGNAYIVVFNYQEMMEDEGDRKWLELVLKDIPVLKEYKDGVIFGL